MLTWQFGFASLLRSAVSINSRLGLQVHRLLISVERFFHWVPARRDVGIVKVVNLNIIALFLKSNGILFVKLSFWIRNDKRRFFSRARKDPDRRLQNKGGLSDSGCSNHEGVSFIFHRNFILRADHLASKHQTGVFERWQCRPCGVDDKLILQNLIACHKTCVKVKFIFVPASRLSFRLWSVLLFVALGQSKHESARNADTQTD